MLIPFMRRCGRFLRCERAVSALEYAVLAGVIIAAVGAALVTFSGNITTAMNNIGGKVAGIDVKDIDTINPGPATP